MSDGLDQPGPRQEEHFPSQRTRNNTREERQEEAFEAIEPKMGLNLGRGTWHSGSSRPSSESTKREDSHLASALCFIHTPSTTHDQASTRSDNESRTQVEQGAYEKLKEGEPEPDLERNEEPTVSVQRRGRRGRRVVVDEGENPDVLIDTHSPTAHRTTNRIYSWTTTSTENQSPDPGLPRTPCDDSHTGPNGRGDQRNYPA